MENLEQYYSIPEEWNNYGDVNPKAHGGMFVRWENDMWHIIETHNENEIPMDNGHMFEHMWLEPMDIWVNGDPKQGFTETAINQLETFSGLPFEVLNPEDIPEGETYEEYVSNYMNQFGSLIGYLVHGFRGYLYSDPEYAHDYWGYLSGQGIEKEKF